MGRARCVRACRIAARSRAPRSRKKWCEHGACERAALRHARAPDRALDRIIVQRFPKAAQGCGRARGLAPQRAALRRAG
eukprot:3960347-Lingulodinium_polyedra.AAC.1